MSTTLHELVEANLRGALELTPSRRIDPDETFDRYGLDSISAFRLARRLSAALEIDVEPRVIAEHATLSLLAAHLADRFGRPAPATDDKGALVEKLLALFEKSPQLLGALRTLHAGTSPGPSPSAATAARPGGIDFGFIFFSTTGEDEPARQYDYISHIAKYADEHGFGAIWIPERHFSPFGGRFPDPGMLLSYLAAQTHGIRLRSGSVVLPLHHPARVAESWSMLDHLSRGRVDMAFAAGWNVNDFVLSPDTYSTLRETWIDRMALVKRLWRGEAIAFPNGQGQPKEIVIYPRPVQPDLNVWMTVTSEEQSFVDAGRHGYNVLTMLQSRSAEQLADKIAKYRRARAEAGFDPDAGRVSLMLHTYVHPDEATVTRTVQKHFLKYITSALRGHAQRMEHKLSEAELAGIAEHSYHHQYRNSALFGSVAHCADVVDRMRTVGVNEIACLVDFGPSENEMYDTLPFIQQLMQRVNGLPVEMPTPQARPSTRDREAPAPIALAVPPVSAPDLHEEYAIVGLSGRYPDATYLDEFWTNLLENRNCLREIDAVRLDDLCGSTTPREQLGTIRHFGLLNDIYRFDAAFFGLSRREAEVLDPHMRLLLEEVWSCVENAGCAPRSLAGSKTGVFVSFYNYEYGNLLDELEVDRASEPYLATATAGTIMANRVSYVLGLRGPSEVYNTACSSSLVALHRAAQSLAAGECDRAIVAGANLLLTGARVRALSRMGLLSEGGLCNPFSYPANGEILGEGVGAIMLRPLSRAIADGDFIYAVVSGSDVGHPGSQSGSLTMPCAKTLTDLMAETYRKLTIDKRQLCYIEGHGAGSAVDVVELSAYDAFLADAVDGVSRVGIGSVKSNIGFGEASGGVAQLTKCAMALSHGIVPASLNFTDADPAFDGSRRAIAVQTSNSRVVDSPLPKYASIVAYGLGGSAAHVVMRQHRPEPLRLGESQRPGPHPIPFSAVDANQLAGFVARVANHLRSLDRRDGYARLCGGESGLLTSMALTLAARDRAQAHRVVMLVSSVAEFLDACRDFLSGTAREHIVTSGGQAAFICSERLVDACVQMNLTRDLAELWVHGTDISWAKAYNRPAYQKLPLPSAPFGGERLRLPRKQAAHAAPSILDRVHISSTANEHVVNLAIRSDDYFISQHVVDGVPIMPATGYLGLLSAISSRLFGGRPCTLRGITWAAPFAVVDESTLLCLEVDGRGRFRAYHVAGDEKTLCCSGRIEQSCEANPGARLDPSTIERADIVLDRKSYWALADSEISKQRHGPILRRTERILRVRDQLIAVLSPPAVSVPLPEIAWLDAAVGVTLGFAFVEGLPPTSALAFSLESFALARAFPVDAPVYAVATKRATHGSLIDISLEDASVVYAVLRGFSVRGFDRLHSSAGIRPARDAFRLDTRAPSARGAAERVVEGEFAQGRHASSGGTSELEVRLRTLLSEVLKIGPAVLSEQDDLRRVGFESLAAAELATQLSKELDIDVPPAALLEHRTIRDISRYLVEAGGRRVPAAS